MADYIIHDNTGNDYPAKITKKTNELIKFDLVGVPTELANSLRVIFMKNIATMAIDHVRVDQNSSVMNDAELIHRLTMIPIKADARKFTDEEKILFEIRFVNEEKEIVTVMTSDMKWVPLQDQKERFPKGIRPVHEDIPIIKLRPGEELSLDLYCIKGTGEKNSKWSPVCPATYRLLPEVEITEPVEDAKQLTELCPADVFDIEDMEVVVARPRDCTRCRKCTQFTENVTLGRKRDHFLFSVESVGIYKAKTLVKIAIAILNEQEAAKEPVQ
jgi:DNA-directed RNA polymerase I and III subunit RPAC1